MGIGVFFKNLAPLCFYLSGLMCSLIAMGGNVRWALWLAIFLLPLRNVIDKIQAYPLGNQFIDILLIGVIVGWFTRPNSSQKSFFQETHLNGAVIALFFYMLLSVMWGGIYLHGSLILNIQDSRIQDCKNFILMPIIYFIIVNNAHSKKDIWRIFSVMCLAMFIADYYTANQIHEHSALVARDQIKGTFQFLGPNEVAAFLNFCTIIMLGVFYGFKKSKYRIILLLIIIANIYNILFLYSRGAYVGFILGAMILFAFKDKRILIPIILILCLWKVVLPQNVINRIEETKTESGQLDESSQRRIDIWEIAFNYFKSNPFIGIGFGSFRHLGLDLKDTHNIYVKILTEQGIVGFVLLLFIIFAFIREGFRLYQKGDDELSKSFGIGFVACVVTVMVNNFFGDRWSYLEPNAYLWVFAGLVARLNYLTQNPVLPQKANDQLPVAQQIMASSPPLLKKKQRYYDPPGK